MSAPLPEAVREQIRKLRTIIEWGGHHQMPIEYAIVLNGTTDMLAQLEAAAQQERAHFWLQTPSHERDGIAPVETSHHCLYTQVKPCKEIYTDPDFWCGFCSETNLIPAASHPPPTPEDR